MPTDGKDNQATTNTNTGEPGSNTNDNGNGKVTFTQEQQDRVNQLIREAQGRAARELRTELDETRSQLQQMQSDLEAARQSSHDPSKTAAQRAEAKDDVAELQRQIDEMKTARQSKDRQLETMQQQLKAKDDELKNEKSNSLNIRKQVAITEAAQQSAEFVSLDVVRTLTEKYVQWDPQQGKFVVLNDHGQPRMNSAFEEMTMKEFFEDFAEKNPYLVRSGAKTGTDATTANRSSLASNGRYTVEQIFGPKSTPKLANELAQKNMPEYKRLKAEARAKGIIA